MKKISISILITVFSLLHLCSCSNMTGIIQETGDLGAHYSNNTEPSDSTTAASDITEATHDQLNIKYGRFYSVYEEDYKQIQETINESVWNQVREMNNHFSEDVANGVIPKTLHIDYHGTDCEFTLISEKYKNWTSFVCPTVIYRDANQRMELQVDAFTHGDKYYELSSSVPASAMQQEGICEKNENELLSIAKNYIVPKLEKLSLNEEDYRIIIQEPTPGRPKDTFYFYFVSLKTFLGNTEIAQVAINNYGFIKYVLFNGFIVLDPDFEARLPEIDELELIEQANNRFREPGCDCNLSVSYRVFLREYNGEQYAELQCAIIPDNNNPETHHHDYINNQFCVFLELTD